MRCTPLLVALAIAACSDGGSENPETPPDATDAGDASASNQPPDATTPGSPDAGVEPLPDVGEVPSTGPCNGQVELCERAFDDVTFPCTHNAHSAQEYGYPVLNANQVSGLQKQLDDGVRCMLMDTYEQAGEHVLCHGPCGLASTPFVDALSTLKAFLDAHPREVITLIIEDHLPVDAMVEDFVSTGLDALAYTHEAGTPWPTLGEMIAANTRLVVTAEQGAPPPAWFHHVWDVAWDTPYTFMSQGDFSCALNRGARENELFLLNHWVNTGFNLPSEDNAKIVNTYEVLHGRAQQCWDEAQDRPNFVAVDFYEHGDLFRVVDALNQQ